MVADKSWMFGPGWLNSEKREWAKGNETSGGQMPIKEAGAQARICVPLSYFIWHLASASFIAVCSRLIFFNCCPMCLNYTSFASFLVVVKSFGLNLLDRINNVHPLTRPAWELLNVLSLCVELLSEFFRRKNRRGIYHIILLSLISQTI